MTDRLLVTALCLMLLVTIPGSLSLWLIGLISSGISPTPLRWFFSFLVPSLISGYGYRKGSVDESGAITGFFIAFIFMLANVGFCTSLLVFFVLGSKLTKYKANLKKKIEHDYHKSSRRNWLQALCNCGIAGQLSALYLFETNVGGEVPIDFNYHYTCSWLSVGVVASLACGFGDTLASELGSVMSTRDPILITSFRRVPRGTNGGVSMIGLIVSAFGGFMIGLTYYLTTLMMIDRDTLPLHSEQWPIIWIGTLAGLIGSLIDSLIGATLQFSGVDKKTGKVVEEPGDHVEHISGFALLDNHSVNLLSTLIIGLGAPMISSNYLSN